MPADLAVPDVWELAGRKGLALAFAEPVAADRAVLDLAGVLLAVRAALSLAVPLLLGVLLLLGVAVVALAEEFAL